MQRLTIKRQTKAKQPHFHITTFYGYLCLYQSISKNHTKNPGGKTSIFIHELNYKKPTIFNGKTQRKSALPLGQDHPGGKEVILGHSFLFHIAIKIDISRIKAV